MDINIIKARSYYYEFFAIPFFFYENETKFEVWKDQLAVLKNSAITPEDNEFFANLEKFSFDEFKAEQNTALFDFSYANVPLSASFYDEGRDEGAMKILVLNTLKKSKFRRNNEFCKDSEDFIGFIFYFMSSLLKDELQRGSNFLSTELFVNVINKFIDEFISLLLEHKGTNFFKNLANLMKSFFALERSLLAVDAPKFEKSVAKEALARLPYENRFKNPKNVFKLDK